MTQRDPLIGAHFALDVDGVVSAFFKEASGFNNASEVIRHQAVDASGKPVIQKIVTIGSAIVTPQNIENIIGI